MQQNSSLLAASSIHKVHFIGIGGISMSGLAEILNSRGYTVTGSDMNTSAITNKLEHLGIKTMTGHSGENIAGADLVVYTAAIREDNPELAAARLQGIPTMDRATLLGRIMKGYPGSIAVSGTHGKTTTTSMISMILLEAGFNPTIHIGGELDAIGGTTHIGSNDYFVAEACEYYESFLKFFPHIAVILNIEFDHADYFKDLDHVTETFRKFAMLVPSDGYLIACADDKNIGKILGSADCKVVTFGMNPDTADWGAANITFDEMGCASYKLFHKGREVSAISLMVPGIHNAGNSLAAIAACSITGCSYDIIKQAFSKFRGTHRRFELKGTIDGIKVIDDYAHHPSEVKATLKAAKICEQSRIWCVFQPHTYTRTKFLMNEFATAFEDADEVILTDIYAAREIDKGEVNSEMLAYRIKETGKKVRYIKGFNAIVEQLKKHVKPGDLVITMGAGDIYKVGEMFLEEI